MNEYGLVVKFYIFGKRANSRYEAYRCSKAILPGGSVTTVCHRFADAANNGRKPVLLSNVRIWLSSCPAQRLCAMVYRVRRTALEHAGDNLDDIPEKAYIDKFSDTHCRNDCRPLINVTFACETAPTSGVRQTPRRWGTKQASKTLQARMGLDHSCDGSDSDSEVEIIACTTVPSKRKRMSEAEVIESRTASREGAVSPRKKVKKFQPVPRVRYSAYHHFEC